MSLSIRNQLLLGFTALLVLGGSAATLLLSRHLTSDLREESIRRARAVGESLATWSEEAVLTEDVLELTRLTRETKGTGAEIVYVFVHDPRGNVLAHTFERGFPADLHPATSGREMTLLDTEEGPVRDIAAEILGGRGGEVHIGYSESGMLASVSRMRGVLWLIAIPVYLIGILSIWFVSGFLTRPVTKLTEVVHRFGSGELDARVTERFAGETGSLAEAFNTMAGNLELQAGELRYLTEYNQNLIDNLGIGIYVLSRDLKIQYANRELTREVGTAEGRSCYEVICGRDGPCEGCVAVRSRDVGGVHRRNCRLPDGRWLEQTAIPIPDSDGRIDTIVTRRDITEDLRLRETITQHEKLAAVGELAAGVAHEVNNPLDGMQSLLRLALDDGSLPTGSRKHLEMVEKGLARMEMVVRRLLTFTADQAEPNLETTVEEQIEQAYAFVGLRLEDSGVETEIRVATGCPRIRIDPNRFPQVLVNLLLNAADAMADGGRLTIRAEPDESGVLIAFEDDGPGIPAEDRDRIFRPFFTTKEAGKGTGLGLAVSRRIIMGHGGTLGVRASPAGGAAFEIRIPATDVAPARPRSKCEG